LEYPESKKLDVVEDFHGTKVEDPYKWLEDLDSPETKEWIDRQNKLTFDYLSKIPHREKIRQRLTELWDYEKYGIPFHRSGSYFLMRNDGLQNHYVLYQSDSLEGEPKVLLDPNSWSEDGTISLQGFSVTEDGRYMAYGRSTSGTDWSEWKILDIDTGKEFDELLKWIKFSSASWKKDGSGFYYNRYDEPTGDTKLDDINYFQKLYFHEVGTDQSRDRLIYKREDHKDWRFGAQVTEDGEFLIMGIWIGTDPKNMVLYQKLNSENDGFEQLIDDFEAQFVFLGNDGAAFWFRTDLDAPRGRVIAIDITKPGRATWKEVIPESKDTLQFVSLVGDRFIAGYLHDAHTLVKVFGLDGSFERDVDLPGLGTAGGFGGRRSDDETFYMFTSFTEPGAIYRYEVSSGKSSLFKKSEAQVNPEDFETRQVFYKSKDGTSVPMFIVHRKGLKGPAPTILHGYGGFNIPMVPGFSLVNYLWMQMGGIYAQACLRGGGEYGEEWHQAGSKHSRQNVYDDFISAGEWLIENGYTSSSKLAIQGGSNGGLLVGASLNQRPDVFGAAAPSRGVMDMLHFHKSTIGWAWTSDYGSPDEPEDFKHLYAYSPLHNVKEGTNYPPTLITTADHDDRVVPYHSFKYAAALQAAQGGEAPILIRIETSAGHGMGTPTTKLIQEAADVRSFLAHVLGLEVPVD
jgi:prolyl oligopeptidase